jgi:hypothetical protein
MTMSTTTIGPVVERECGYCEGAGRRADAITEATITCELCNGTGRIPVEVHPFVDLERAMEHVQAIWTSMGLRRTETFKPKIGTPAYHVDAVEDALGSLFQQLVVMLPDEHNRTES